MQITEDMVQGIAIAVGGLVVIYLALSGRLEKLLKAFSSYGKGLEPMRLKDLQNETHGKTWNDAKTRK